MKTAIIEFAKNTLTKIFVIQQKQIIKKHKLTIVAVVGSVGKTSTKLAIATILSQGLRVQVQNGNYNTPISVPFIFTGRSLPSLYNPFAWFWAWAVGQKYVWSAYPYDVVIVELGTDKPGDIAAFKASLHPDITVITAVSEEHMEFFGTLDAVAAEELSVSEFSDKLVLNSDDVALEYISKYITDTTKMQTFGYATADYTINAVQDGAGYEMQIVNSSNNLQLSAYVALPAKHSLKAVAAAAVVANILGVDKDKIQRGMAAVKAPFGRMQLIKGIKNSTIIDDTYNSSPLAVIAALETLYEKDAPQKIALLGNMNELGETSQASHEAIGRLCDYKQLDLVVTLGLDANKYLAPIAESLGCNVKTAKTPYEAAAMIAEELKDGAVVLAKGSQNGVFAEEAVKELLANPDDVDKLVRQSEFWLNKKQAMFNGAKN